MKARIKSLTYSTGAFLYKNRYFFGRLLIALVTAFLTCILIFLLIRLIPDNVVDRYALELSAIRNIPLEEARKLAVTLLNYDPNENFFQQFFRYLGGLFSGNLGQSIYQDITANEIIANALPWTLLVSTIALALSYWIGTAMGSRMAWKRNKLSDIGFTGYVVASSSIPDYLFGLIILYIFAYTLGWFPTNGNFDIMNQITADNFTFNNVMIFLGDVLYHAILPVLAYTFAQIGGWALMMKGSAVSVLGDDYVNAAVARGLPERVIVRKYLKKNAKLPLVTSLAINFAYLFGGSVVMETIFNYPGIGAEFSKYIAARDYFVMQGLFFFISIIVIFANLVSDSIYSLVDPRIRRGV